MIKYLKVVIKPVHFSGTDMRKLHIRIKDSRYPEHFFERLCELDELVSFFEQIWDCAGKEILNALKAKDGSSVKIGNEQA